MTRWKSRKIARVRQSLHSEAEQPEDELWRKTKIVSIARFGKQLSSTQLPDLMQEVARSILTKTKDDGKEHGAVFYEDVENFTVVEIQGSKRSFEYPDILETKFGTRLTDIHSHPSSDRWAFIPSKQDVEVTSRKKLRMAGIVDLDGNFLVYRLLDNWQYIEGRTNKEYKSNVIGELHGHWALEQVSLTNLEGPLSSQYVMKN